MTASPLIGSHPLCGGRNKHVLELAAGGPGESLASVPAAKRSGADERRRSVTAAGVTKWDESGGVATGGDVARCAGAGFSIPSPVLALPEPRWHSTVKGSPEWGELVREARGWGDAELRHHYCQHVQAGACLTVTGRVKVWMDVWQLLRAEMAFRFLWQECVNGGGR